MSRVHGFVHALFALCAMCCLLAMHPAALAHKPSDSHLTLDTHADGHIHVEWHIALRDLDNELRLDANEDGRLNWREVRTRWSELVGYTQPHLSLTHDGHACPVVDGSAQAPVLSNHIDGRYAVMRWRHQCPASQAASLTIDYKLFALADATHRGIVRLRSMSAQGGLTDRGIVVMGGERPAHKLMLDTSTASSSRPGQQMNAAGRAIPTSFITHGEGPSTTSAGEADSDGNENTAWPTLLRFAHEGILHIASGIDHVLFLASLLLVAVWRRAPSGKTWRSPMQGWSPRPDWRSTLREVCVLVTAFTVAHSITLCLAAMGVLSPPSQWIESLIAASVILAVLDNLYPILHAPRWAVVFVFGLVHGFGFAGPLQDLGLQGGQLAWPLLGFNLGVEAGQLLIVAALLPPAYLLRHTQAYRWGVVLPASLSIAVLSGIWLVERAGDVVILGWAV